RVRVGLFVLDRAGHPTQEVAGSAAAADGAFSLQVTDKAPAAGSRLTLTQDMLAWPGVVGNVSFSGSPRAALARVGAYLDNDNSGSFSPSDTLLDSTVTRPTPGGIIVLWADARFQATASRGFSATFEPGWNLFTVEAGKTVTATRVTRLDNLRLDVFSR
ncbi:MAG TPA: hypothetical protein VHN99_00675, partial [Deinococcales bacterium]|nr:hypothetical protein [Deinococcales bacterium]